MLHSTRLTGFNVDSFGGAVEEQTPDMAMVTMDRTKARGGMTIDSSGTRLEFKQ